MLNNKHMNYLQDWMLHCDCGLFAIATCVALAYDQQPYNSLQSYMRSHWIKNGKLVVFPSI